MLQQITVKFSVKNIRIFMFLIIQNRIKLSSFALQENKIEIYLKSQSNISRDHKI